MRENTTTEWQKQGREGDKPSDAMTYDSPDELIESTLKEQARASASGLKTPVAKGWRVQVSFSCPPRVGIRCMRGELTELRRNG